MICAPGTFTTRPFRSEEIVIVLSFMDINAFHQVTGDLNRLAARLHRQTITGEFHHIYSRFSSDLLVRRVTKAAPVKILTPVCVLEIIRIDRVTHSSVGHRDDHAKILEWSHRRAGDSHTGSAAVMVTPNTKGVVQDILPVDIIDVGSPEGPFWLPGRSCSRRECFTDQSPIDKIPAPVDWDLTEVVSQPGSGGIGVEIPVPPAVIQNRRVGAVACHHRVVVIRHLATTTTNGKKDHPQQVL